MMKFVMKWKVQSRKRPARKPTPPSDDGDGEELLIMESIPEPASDDERKVRHDLYYRCEDCFIIRPLLN